MSMERQIQARPDAALFMLDNEGGKNAVAEGSVVKRHSSKRGKKRKSADEELVKFEMKQQNARKQQAKRQAKKQRKVSEWGRLRMHGVVSHDLTVLVTASIMSLFIIMPGYALLVTTILLAGLHNLLESTKQWSGSLEGLMG